MDGWMDGWMGIQDVWMDGWMDAWTDGCMMILFACVTRMWMYLLRLPSLYVQRKGEEDGRDASMSGKGVVPASMQMYKDVDVSVKAPILV